MSNIQEWSACKKAGANMNREEMSLMVDKCVEEYIADKSYKKAMELAGRLKAMTQAAKSDGYWTEQVNRGYTKQKWELESLSNSRDEFWKRNNT